MKDKVTKKKARAYFDKGFRVYLAPSKVPVRVLETSMWLSWYEIKKGITHVSPINIGEAMKFDQVVNSFEYHNCCEELGLIVAYYIDSNDNKKREAPYKRKRLMVAA